MDLWVVNCTEVNTNESYVKYFRFYGCKTISNPITKGISVLLGEKKMGEFSNSECDVKTHYYFEKPSNDVNVFIYVGGNFKEIGLICGKVYFSAA